MKKIKVKIGKRLKSFISDIFKQLPLAVFAALVILSLIIALPFTEKYLNWMSFDLNTKDSQYYEKIYILKIQTNSTTEKEAVKEVEELVSILEKRLYRYAVESVKFEDYKAPAVEEEDTSTEIEISGEDNLTDSVVINGTEDDVKGEETQNVTESEEILLDTENNPLDIGTDLLDVGDDSGLTETKETIVKYKKLIVTTTKLVDSIDTLILTRNDLMIVTPKDDVNFEDTENPIAIYLPENYNETEFTRNRFRTILIKELPTSAGDKAYFSIYKVKALHRKAFLELLDKYAGKSIGIQTDGFVTPYTVPAQFESKTYTTGSYKPDFSPGITQDKESAKLYTILFNSGVIDVDYELFNEEISEVVTNNEVDYPTAFFALIGGLIFLIVYFIIKNKEDIQKVAVFASSLLITYAIWLVYLKYFNILVDIDVLLFSIITVVTFLAIKIFVDDKRNTIKIVYFLTSLILLIASRGLLKIFATQLFSISVISLIVTQLVKWFMSNISKMIRK